MEGESRGLSGKVKVEVEVRVLDLYSRGTPLLVGGTAASGLREPLKDLGAMVLDSLPELRARLRELGEAE